MKAWNPWPFPPLWHAFGKFILSFILFHSQASAPVNTSPSFLPCSCPDHPPLHSHNKARMQGGRCFPSSHHHLRILCKAASSLSSSSSCVPWSWCFSIDLERVFISVVPNFILTIRARRERVRACRRWRFGALRRSGRSHVEEEQPQDEEECARVPSAAGEGARAKTSRQTGQETARCGQQGACAVTKRSCTRHEGFEHVPRGWWQAMLRR